MKQLFHKYKQHLFAFLTVIAVSIAFVPQTFNNFPDIKNGKSIVQSDITHVRGMAAEIKEYKKASGEKILWTNSQFSGMPTYLISTPTDQVLIKRILPLFPKIWSTIFIGFAACFIMLLAFGVRPWIAAIGAIGIGLATENLTLLNVGHTSKAFATAILPLIIAGVQLAFNKKYLLGLTVLGLGMGLQLVVNHLQITYYSGIIVGLFVLFQIIFNIKKGDIMHVVKASGVSILGVVLALGANALPLMLINEYSKSTIRSKSELSIKKTNGRIVDEEQGSGLPKSYAFSYSAGYSDIVATIIPNYSGGDTNENTKLYYGDIGSTSGPKYVGVILFFLMVLGFVLTEGAIRWWSISTIIVIWILSMGINHFSGLNEFLFNSLPFYNKFRAPSMILGLLQIAIGVLAFVGLERLLKLPKNDEGVKNKIKWTAIGSLGLLLILTFFSGMFNDFKTNPVEVDPMTGTVIADRDLNSIKRGLGENASINDVYRVHDRLADDRKEVMKKDGYRSIILTLLMFAIIWFYYRDKIDLKIALAVLGLLVVIDMWGVGKRYLPAKKFKSQKVVDSVYPAHGADQAILQDQGYYRVLDLGYERTNTGQRINPINSSETSYHHKSIGGYHAAKLRRYQELWDWHLIDALSSGQVVGNGLLDMLNMKYIMFPGQQQQGRATQYTPNQGANGHAWFVSNVKMAENADSAIAYLGGLDTKTTAVIETKYGQVSAGPADSSSTIRLTNYHPEHLEYESNSTSDELAIFSEVHYADGWNAYIDGELVDHLCANYVLRGLKIPAGKRKVEFKFEPETFAKGSTISTIFNVVLILLVLGVLALWFKKELSAPSANEA